LSPVEKVIADALTIAAHAVTMTVKNQLIVNALRDGKSFDQPALVAAAQDEFHRLAEASRDTAARVEERLERDAAENAGLVYPGGKPIEVSEEQRRSPDLLRQVAAAMDEVTSDTAVLDRLVADAKAAAWDEVGTALAQRLAVRPEEDPYYVAGLELRIRTLIREDLAKLAQR
jgi:hypothetical protein